MNDEGADPPVILVLGGTGMLLPAVRELHSRGYHLALAARHATSLRLPNTADATSWTPINADWSDPENYVHTCQEALSGRIVTAMISWVHRPYRDTITTQLAGLVRPGGRVVRLWGTSGETSRRAIVTAPPLPDRAVCDVLLGANTSEDGTSWLTHEQISEATVRALMGTMPELLVGDILPGPAATGASSAARV